MAGPLLRITPEKVIEFPVVLFSSSTVELHLENTADTFVAFKIKTTAPKSYLVRPSTGIIPRGGKEVVHIVLQPLSEEPTRPCSDRFLIQSTAVSSDAPLARDYWQTLDRDRIEDTRLSVVYRTSSSSGDHVGGAMGAADGNGPSSGRGGYGGASSSQGGSYSADLKSRYDQLVEYALALERHKDELVKENEALKAQIGRKGAAQKSGGMGVFELWHIPVYIFIGVVIWYFFGRSAEVTK
ncbi:vesicle-associated membrane protein-associated protein A, related [Neospora caninum Liverpool]|uniref:Vesicle-associated membrane protein-associated protein A, related n=1 Tax=Neospora caninum (strain Liverpool) TaxID=572307 RepID=F0VAH7_NEOCL|nr:vesicle-associated membrane protein-associated protein A, related [Neospora caninum Liverpool]CBZ50666.1 vesicle-associated membrane protein-associated protein A, related [Neospora caninum Liverpool]CEL65277.1 TPA: Vesicle-associated membrane protein-associated protein A, related [Neospora caninum Liverpool]|eukprot:XP_003880699.1 vesicle-associated membrane protein-associated protein A, related [Neospora caninum Liverpool]